MATDLKYANHRDYTQDVAGFAAACVLLSSLAMTARCSARYASGTPVGADDVFAVLSFLALLANLIACIVVAANGAVSTSPATRSQAMTITQCFHAINYSYTTSLVLAKLSLLFLYRRIFGMHKQWFRILWWTLFVWAGPLLLLTCIVFNSVLAYHGTGAPNTPGQAQAGEVIAFYCAITYLGILALPIGMVVGLQMDRMKKLGLICIFSLGTLGVASSFVRAIRTVQAMQQHWDARYSSFQQLMLINGESTALVVCACLPLVRPVVTRMTEFTIGSVRKLTSRPSSRYGSQKSSSRVTSASFPSKATASSKATAEDEVELKRDVIHCRQDYVVTEETEIGDSPIDSIREVEFPRA